MGDDVRVYSDPAIQAIEPHATVLRLVESLGPDWQPLSIADDAENQAIVGLETVGAIRAGPASEDGRFQAKLLGLGLAWRSALQTYPDKDRARGAILAQFWGVLRQKRAELEEQEARAAEMDAEVEAAIARVERGESPAADSGPIPVKDKIQAMEVLGLTHRNYPALNRMIDDQAVGLEPRRGGGFWLHIRDERERRLAWRRFDDSGQSRKS